MNAYLLTVLVLCLFACALWLQGAFRAGRRSRERWAHAARVMLWVASILIVAWPLERYRSALGDATYLAIAVGVLVLFFGLGKVAVRVIMRQGER